MVREPLRAGGGAPPRLSPLLAEDLSGLPPAYIATAGFDPLRDEGEAYAKRLREAGVTTALSRQPDLIHGYVNTVGTAATCHRLAAHMLRIRR